MLQLCNRLARCVVFQEEFGPLRVEDVREVLPRCDYLSLALVAEGGSYLLLYPVLAGGQVAQGRLLPTAKCAPGTAVWAAFESGQPFISSQAVFASTAYRDWEVVQQQGLMQQLITYPLEAVEGALGALTVASSAQQGISVERVGWFADLLGQCLVHVKSKHDLRVAVQLLSSVYPNQPIPGLVTGSAPDVGAASIDTSAIPVPVPGQMPAPDRETTGCPALPEHPADQAGGTVVVFACHGCRAENAVALRPQDLGLHRVMAGAEGCNPMGPSQHMPPPGVPQGPSLMQPASTCTTACSGGPLKLSMQSSAGSTARVALGQGEATSEAGSLEGSGSDISSADSEEWGELPGQAGACYQAAPVPHVQELQSSMLESPAELHPLPSGEQQQQQQQHAVGHSAAQQQHAVDHSTAEQPQGALARSASGLHWTLHEHQQQRHQRAVLRPGLSPHPSDNDQRHRQMHADARNLAEHGGDHTLPTSPLRHSESASAGRGMWGSEGQLSSAASSAARTAGGSEPSASSSSMAVGPGSRAAVITRQQDALRKAGVCGRSDGEASDSEADDPWGPGSASQGRQASRPHPGGSKQAVRVRSVTGDSPSATVPEPPVERNRMKSAGEITVAEYTAAGAAGSVGAADVHAGPSDARMSDEPAPNPLLYTSNPARSWLDWTNHRRRTPSPPATEQPTQKAARFMQQPAQGVLLRSPAGDAVIASPADPELVLVPGSAPANPSKPSGVSASLLPHGKKRASWAAQGPNTAATSAPTPGPSRDLPANSDQQSLALGNPTDRQAMPDTAPATTACAAKVAGSAHSMPAPAQHPFWLTFRERALERKFTTWHNAACLKVDMLTYIMAVIWNLMLTFMKPYALSQRYPLLWPLSFAFIGIWLFRTCQPAWYLRRREPVLAACLAYYVMLTVWMRTENFLAVMPPAKLATPLWLVRLTGGEAMWMLSLLFLVRFRVFFPVQLANLLVAFAGLPRTCGVLAPASSAHPACAWPGCVPALAGVVVSSGLVMPALLIWLSERRTRRRFLTTAPQG